MNVKNESVDYNLNIAPDPNDSGIDLSNDYEDTIDEDFGGQEVGRNIFGLKGFYIVFFALVLAFVASLYCCFK